MGNDDVPEPPPVTRAPLPDCSRDMVAMADMIVRVAAEEGRIGRGW